MAALKVPRENTSPRPSHPYFVCSLFMISGRCLARRCRSFLRSSMSNNVFEPRDISRPGIHLELFAWSSSSAPPKRSMEMTFPSARQIESAAVSTELEEVALEKFLHRHPRF